MTKNDLIETVARKAHLTKKAATESIDTLLQEIQRALVKGEKVVISGFGTFYVDQRAKKKMFLRGREEEVSWKARRISCLLFKSPANPDKLNAADNRNKRIGAAGV